MTRETKHVTWGADPWRAVRTTNTELCVSIKEGTLKDEGSSDMEEHEGRKGKGRGFGDFREDEPGELNAPSIDAIASFPELRVES